MHLIFRLPDERGNFLKDSTPKLKDMSLRIGKEAFKVEVGCRPREKGEFGGLFRGPLSTMKADEKMLQKQIKRRLPEEERSSLGDAVEYETEWEPGDFDGAPVSREFSDWLKGAVSALPKTIALHDMVFDPQDPNTRTAETLAEMFRRLRIRVVHEPRLGHDMVEIDGELVEINDSHINDFRCAIIKEFGISFTNTMVNDNIGSFRNMEGMCLDTCREWLDTMIHGGDAEGGHDGNLAEEWLFPMGVEDNELNRFLSASIIVSIIQKIREPDRIIRFSPTLVGLSGWGKSTLVYEILEPGFIRDHFHTASVNFKLSEKALLENIEGKLVCEADELVGGNIQDVAAIKSFCTKRVFHYRKAFGRRRSEVRNLWTMVGSANPEMPFLADDRGLLLRWPVMEVRHKIQDETPEAYMERIRTGLFQSAHRLYDAGMRTDVFPERFEAEALGRVESFKSVPEHVREAIAVLLGDENEWPEELDMIKGASAGQICEAFPELHSGTDSNRVGKALANNISFASRMSRGRRLYHRVDLREAREESGENVVKPNFENPKRRGKGEVAAARRKYQGDLK